MAVEYEISSDVATITGVASNTQVASIVKFYTGSITYDDEPTSKYASVTINGKTQRVMLCIAVSGTVNYDDVPCLYSTVDGHRTLNVVEPTESGTPDDVPSLYETVVVDGKTVRALRCVLISATPNYDGVSSTCTFTDDGKTHTAQLVNKIVGGSVEVIVKGTSPLTLPDAIADSLSYVKAFGGTEQGLPDGYTALTFIENTSGTYIDLGMPFNDADSELEVTITAVNDVNYIASAREGNVMQGIAGSSTTFKAYIDPVSLTSNTTKTAGHQYKFTFTANNGNATFKTEDLTASTSDTQTTVYTVSQTQPTAHLGLFGNSYGNRTGAGADFYGLKYTVAGELVLDLIPCRHGATVGVFDLVSRQFFTATQGSLLAGLDTTIVPTPDAPMDIVCNNGVLKARHQSGLPLGYQLVEYIKSTDSIVLKDYTTDNTEIKAKFYRESYNVQYAYASNASSALQTNTGAYLAGEGINGAWRFGESNASQITRTNTTYTSIQNKNGVWLNGKQTGTYENISAFTSTVKLRALSNSENAPTRLYYLIHRENGVVIAHYIPCIAPDNTIGLYDIVGGEFYTNSEATITAGSTVSDPVEIYTDGTVETIAIKDDQNATVSSATAEMLLKVGNYQDVQSIIDGVVTRNVGVKVFDGTEDWKFGAVLALGISNSRKTENRLAIPSTHYVGTDVLNVDMPNNSIKFGPTSYAGWKDAGAIFIKDTAYATLNDWKQYLADQYAAGTPVTVIYPLSQATTEQVTPQPMQTAAGDNTAEITQASLSNLELEAKYQKN